MQDFIPSKPLGSIPYRMMTVRTSDAADVSPLMEAERLRVDRALRRLHEAMRDYWSSWPVDRRGPSELSRALGVDRTTCQRVSALARDAYSLASMLDAMPGPRALRSVIEASRGTGGIGGMVDARVLDAFRAAVDAFDEVLLECGPSVSALKRRMSSASHGGPEASHDIDPQESLFLSAQAICGRSIRTISSIGLYDGKGVGDGELRHIRISSYHGIVARADAVPMVLEAFDGVKEGAADPWQRKPALLGGFTSAECRAVDLREGGGFASRALEIPRGESPIDVSYFTAFPVPHPTTLERPIEESWFIMYSPAAALVFDLYLHESVARRCLVSMDVHLWQTSFADSPHGKWHTRLARRPVVVQLGRGVGSASSPQHPGHGDLTGELFRRAEADASEYIGYRCIEPFPIWRAGYRYELDFGGGVR